MSNARFHLIVALGLGALLSLELALHYAPVPPGLSRAALLVLAAVGFVAVVTFHMHLSHEPRGLKLLFALPFVFPLGFGAAIVLEAWLRRAVVP